MEKLGFGLNEDSATVDQKKTNLSGSLLLKVQRCIKVLAHVFQCQDPNDKLPNCQKMKRLVLHAKSCKSNDSGRCRACKELIVLCMYHAKYCQDPKCPISICDKLKNILKQHRLKQRLQRTRILKRYIATMANHRMSGEVFQSSLESPHSFNHPSPGNQPRSSLHLSYPGTVIKPLPGSLVSALQATALKQVTHSNNSKFNPSATDTELMTPKQQMQIHQSLLNPQLGQQQFSQITERPNSIASTMGSPQIMSNPNPSIAGLQMQDFQELLQTLEIKNSEKKKANSSYS